MSNLPSKEQTKMKRNILYLTSPVTLAGVERVILTYLDHCNRSIFNVIIVAFINAARVADNAFIREVQRRGIAIEVIPLTRAFDLSNIGEVIRNIKRYKIDLLHSHGYRADIVGVLAARLARRPIVSTVHGWTPISRKLKLYEYIDKKCLRLFNKILTVSTEIKRELEKSGIDPSKIVKIHNAVTIQNHCSYPGEKTLREDLKFDKDTRLIGMVGRLSPEKGGEYFLMSCKELFKKYQDLKAIILGDGPERRYLENFSKELGINNKVFFLGHRSDVERVYTALDILVVPSITEGVPMVVLEAMAFSKPVVATNVGGVSEIIDDRKTGLLVTPKDPDDLTKKITFLLDNMNFSQALGMKAKALVEDKFNAVHWAREIENHYSVILH